MDYFESLREELDRVYALAQEARRQAIDPENEVEIPIAKDVAARVEGLVGPRGIASIIREMEQSGLSRPEIAFNVAEKLASGEIIRGDKRTLIEQAVRTSVGILTEGVLVAPTEGVADVQINQNPDGSDYVSLFFAGPIRSAGGTVAALSVALADHARKRVGIGDYRPTETEISRYVEEVNVYEHRCVHLQYKPPDEHVRHIIRNCPVCVDGDPTEEVEVSVHRNLERIKSNRIRGGVPLVVCEGIAAKAPKVLKFTKKFGLGWDWLSEVIKVKKKADKVEIKPDDGYLDGLVAGRPVFSYPMRPGGFRLRYGRSRTNGIMGRSIHPATMVMVDSFIANGTHLKVERPGKGAILTACDSIEPSVVKLTDGSVVKVRTTEQAEELKEDLEEILFLGDMLITYGDFLKSNHPLMPGGYCYEWWVQEAKEAGVEVVPKNPTAKEAIELSRKNKIPLHPDYTYPWNDINNEKLGLLASALSGAALKLEAGEIAGAELPSDNAKRVLEELLVEHKAEEEKILLGGEDAYALLSSFGMLNGKEISAAPKLNTELSPLENICALSDMTIRNKAPTYIGARMGRPEKAKERAMDGKPNVLFPTATPRDRSITKRYKSLKARDKERTINVEIARYSCTGCGGSTFHPRCHSCGEVAKPERICQKCNSVTEQKEHCDMPTLFYNRRPVPLVELYDKIKAELGFAPQEIKGVKGLVNEKKISEVLEKGFYRAKHNIYVFRDGTCRFDATDAPMTHFRISEIGQTVEGIKELGYTVDYLGKPIKEAVQVVPLKCQDIVVSSSCMEYMRRVADFVDDLLVNVYGLSPFYNLESDDGLLGHLVVGLSPHTSGGVLGRIIGYCDANVGYAHPYFHTAKRRNCFHPGTNIVIWDDKSKKQLQKKLSGIAEEAFKNSSLSTKRLDQNTERVTAPDGLYVHSVDPKSHKIIRKKIKYFIKTTPPDKWLEISTATNRKMRVTPDHNILYVDEKGKLQSIEAEKLSEGADIPVCLKLDSHKSNVGELNLARELCVLGPKDKEEIRLLAKEFFKKLYYEKRKRIRGLLPAAFRDMPIRWYSSVPLSHFEILVQNGICDFDDIPDSARIALKRDNMTLPVRFPVNNSLMAILGYFVSEGHARKSKSCYQTCFRICNKTMRKKLLTAIKDVFGKKPYVEEEDTQIVLCSRIIYLLFTKIMGMGSGARSKRLPHIVFSSSDELIKAFLSAYFDGDGSAIATPPSIYFYSVSQDLLEDLGTLLLRFGIFCRYGKAQPRLPGRKVPERCKEPGKKASLSSLNCLSMYGPDLYKFAEICSPNIQSKLKRMQELRGKGYSKNRRFIKYENRMFPIISQSDYICDKVKEIKQFSENVPAYCLDVEGDSLEEKNILLNNQIFTIRCDGDEDCVILLADCLINFSRSYLSNRRGGTMDAPLTLTPQLNPSEVDDEVHCMEVLDHYPLEFYHACERNAFPGEVKLLTVQDLLGKEGEYGDLHFTHDTATINDGPMRTAYVTLGSIPEKIEAEFRLHSKLRAVNIQNAAERLILSHFIPDLYGNLRSYSRQTFRCVDCNTIYRRTPLAGKCTRCGGKLTLTIHKGGILKYLEISKRMVEEYSLPMYLAQRLELLESEIGSIFEDEKIKQTGLSDFM